MSLSLFLIKYTVKKEKYTLLFLRHYTKEEAFAIAKQYPTRMALHNANLSVYTYLYTKKLHDECFSKVDTSSPNI